MVSNPAPRRKAQRFHVRPDGRRLKPVSYPENSLNLMVRRKGASHIPPQGRPGIQDRRLKLLHV